MQRDSRNAINDVSVCVCVCVRWEFPAQDNFDVQYDICLYYFVDVHVAFFA